MVRAGVGWGQVVSDWVRFERSWAGLGVDWMVWVEAGLDEMAAVWVEAGWDCAHPVKVMALVIRSSEKFLSMLDGFG